MDAKRGAVLAVMKRRRKRENELMRIIMRHQQTLTTTAQTGMMLLANVDDDDEPSRQFAVARRLGNFPRPSCDWIQRYLSTDSIYNGTEFRRKFCVPRTVFCKVHTDLIAYNSPRWSTRTLVTGRKAIPSELKVLLCLNILATGNSFNSMELNAIMDKETARTYFHFFIKDIKILYGDNFLNRLPSRAELRSIETCYAENGFAGCVGAVDCCKVLCKNCSVQWKDQFHNSKEEKVATIIAEVWSDKDRYIWHWVCRVAGANKDKAVMRTSPLFLDVMNGVYKLETGLSYKASPEAEERMQNYVLVDGIYPDWPLFVKPIHEPRCTAERRFSNRQEVERKDVDCAFGILQGRFRIMRRVGFLYYIEDIIAMTEAVVILHNLMTRMRQIGALEETGEKIDNEHDAILEQIIAAKRGEAKESVREKEEADEATALAQQEAVGFLEQMDNDAMREALLTGQELHDGLTADLVSLYKP